MILWIVLTILTSLAVVGVTIPLVRRHDLTGARDTNVAFLRTQLADIDAQETTGTIGPQEAEGMRMEIRRRILAEGLSKEPDERPLDARALPWMAVALAGVIAIAATGLYAAIGRPDMTTPRATPPQTADASGSAHPVADVPAMIAQLEQQMQQTPNNAEGWRMLGWSYRSVGRSADAAKAYARAIAINPNNADYQSAEGDALVDVSRGQVTGEALTAFQAAVKIDPSDPRSRYFLALYDDQHGKHDEAMSAWIALLKSAPPGAPWVNEVRDFVMRVAQARHIDISGKLPAPSASAPSDQSAAAGPTQEQIQAAGQMPSGDRDAMIRGMVDRLAGELKANPHNAEGWIRLMRARMVLGDTAAAAGAFRDARHAFADTAPEQLELRNAAKSLGISGG